MKAPASTVDNAPPVSFPAEYRRRSAPSPHVRGTSPIEQENFSPKGKASTWSLVCRNGAQISPYRIKGLCLPRHESLSFISFLIYPTAGSTPRKSPWRTAPILPPALAFSHPCPPAFLTGHIEQVFHVLPVIMLAEASAQFHAIAPGNCQRRRIIVSDARKDFRHTHVKSEFHARTGRFCGISAVPVVLCQQIANFRDLQGPGRGIDTLAEQRGSPRLFSGRSWSALLTISRSGTGRHPRTVLQGDAALADEPSCFL